MQQQLIDGRDFTVLPGGKVVFTALYLEERGYCCGFGCRNCPYQYMNVPEPKRGELLKARKNEQPGK